MAYEQVLRRLSDFPEPALGEQVARALANKRAALGESDPE